MFDQLWLLPPRQRIEARAEFARALTLAAPGARIVASVANDEGARSAEADFEDAVRPCRGFLETPLPRVLDRSRPRPRRPRTGRRLDRRRVAAAHRRRALEPARRIRVGSYRRRLGAARGASAGRSRRTRRRSRQRLRLSRVRSRTALRRRRRARPVRGTGHRARSRAREPRRARAARRLRLPLARRRARPDAARFRRRIRRSRDWPRRLAGTRAGVRALRPAAAAAGGRLLLVANRYLPYERTLAEHYASRTVLADEQGYKVIAATRSDR